jgi:predicted GH43/DUF377 family glycosyl hydrolase
MNALSTWKKLGVVYVADGQWPWMRTHAAMPVVWPLADGRLRVYFACRDALNRSAIGWAEVDAADPSRVLATAKVPALSVGLPGHFDDCGVYPGSLVQVGDRLRLYYSGWISGARAPMFYAAVGVAESLDGGLTFERLFRAPVLDRNELDPVLVLGPCVLEMPGGGYRMWYSSGLPWCEEAGSLSARYHIRTATSGDGFTWQREATPAIPVVDGDRTLTRPCVLFEDGRYRMWFGANRGEGSRLAYAESADGITWERLDGRAGLALDGDPAQAFPWVQRGPACLMMFYNADRVGRDGFHVAIEMHSARA